MMPDKDLTDDVLDEIIAGAKTSMEQYLALSLKAERAAKHKADDEIGSWHNDKNTPASHTSEEHVRYESNAGGNLWIQCSWQKYEKMKAAGMVTRVLYERPQSAQQNIPENIPDRWMMVQVEPTPEMREAYHKARDEYEEMDGLYSPDHHWKAMLGSAPKREVK